MDPQVRVFTPSFVRLAAFSLGTACVLALLGYVPTVRAAGTGVIDAMLVGIGISLLASLMGAVPVGLAAAWAPEKIPQAVLASTALRFLAVLALAAPLLLTAWFDRLVMGVWVGISYMAMLVVDTVFAVRMSGAAWGRKP